MKKLTFEYVYNYFKEHGCELLAEEYINARTKMPYKCKCKNKSEITFDQFKRGHRCFKCAGNERLTFEYVYSYFKEQGCELLSKSYRNAHIKLNYICNCGNTGETSFEGFKNGARCKKCILKKISGRNNYNWNPNLTDEERQKNRKSNPFYVEWIKKVYEKDDYTCKYCEERGGKLCAHHLESYGSNKELRTELSNGVCLCEKDHKEFHKKYGYGNNTKTQFNEFLKNRSSE